MRLERWGPRIIDIDILVMQDETGRAITMQEPALELPHPRMHERAFVLVPLNDIAPSLPVARELLLNGLPIATVRKWKSPHGCGLVVGIERFCEPKV